MSRYLKAAALTVIAISIGAGFVGLAVAWASLAIYLGNHYGWWAFGATFAAVLIPWVYWMCLRIVDRRAMK